MIDCLFKQYVEQPVPSTPNLLKCDTIALLTGYMKGQQVLKPPHTDCKSSRRLHLVMQANTMLSSCLIGMSR